jgi:hypothetical protein
MKMFVCLFFVKGLSWAMTINSSLNGHLVAVKSIFNGKLKSHLNYYENVCLFVFLGGAELGCDD